jgi:hypothetical protein
VARGARMALRKGPADGRGHGLTRTVAWRLSRARSWGHSARWTALCRGGSAINARVSTARQFAHLGQ